MIFNPLEQFEIYSLLNLYQSTILNTFGLNLSITNSIFFLIFSLIFFYFFVCCIYVNKGFLKPTRFQYIFEIIYKFVLDMLIENINIKAQKYFTWIFTIFIFILLCNVSGMIPYTFTLTSHILITFWLALSVFIAINIILIKTHKIKAFNLFLPSGAPIGLVPLLVFIEFISHFLKVISLPVRLFANMMSGHILLKVLIGFAWIMMTKSTFFFLLHFLPLFIVFLLIGLELAVAIIQAYIFTILICIYLNDVINLH